MKQEVKQQWLAALRGKRRQRGENAGKKYLQTQGTMQGPNGYCCLGVLSDIYQVETGDGRWTGHKDDRALLTNDGSSEGSTLANAVIVWAEISQDGIWVGGHDRLATKNDDGVTFEALADLIEENL